MNAQAKGNRQEGRGSFLLSTQPFSIIGRAGKQWENLPPSWEPKPTCCWLPTDGEGGDTFPIPSAFHPTRMAGATAPGLEQDPSLKWPQTPTPSSIGPGRVVELVGTPGLITAPFPVHPLLRPGARTEAAFPKDCQVLAAILLLV